MSPLLEQALKSLTVRINLATGLSHPSDESATKELFKLLHKEDERLVASEIATWAGGNGWKSSDALQLGTTSGDIIAQLKARVLAAFWSFPVP